jgi:Bacterial antitoxin of type II TA system, VapB
MVRRKATITLDRQKATDAMALLEMHTMSEVIDLALTRLIEAERLRRDVAAYGQTPPTDADIALAEIPVTFDLDDAEVDYESDYGTNG